MDQQLVNELRQMFLDGATPSSLMERIQVHHSEEDNIHWLIKDYFNEAFDISPLRHGSNDGDYAPDSKHAHFVRDVVPEIISNIEKWNHSDLQDTWLNGLSVSTFEEHKKRLATPHFEELDRIWDQLNEREKNFIIGRIARKDYFWDVMKALAALAERLQQKVDELQTKLNQEVSATQP